MITDLLRGQWSSASNALADRLCRGRYQAQIHLPELPRSEASEAGTVIHALWTGTEPPRQATADEQEKAEALREQEAKVAAGFSSPEAELVRIVERRLWHEFPAVSDDPDGVALKTSGQFDVALVHPEFRRALICDGKSGWLPVTPNPSNLQLRRLAALLWLQLDAREIGVCILKPFGKMEPSCVYVEPGPPSFRCRDGGRRPPKPRPQRAPDGRRGAMPLLPGPGCLPGAPGPGSGGITGRGPAPADDGRAGLDPGAARALFLEREKEVRDWLAARKEEIKALLSERPEAVPGYGLKPGRTTETISDPQEVLDRFCHRLGGTPKAFMKRVAVAKSALKNELRALSSHQGKALEAELDALLAGVRSRNCDERAHH